MIVALPFPATIDDLMRVEGKAELINGRIVEYMASGELPSIVATNILLALLAFVRPRSLGRAYGNDLGYALPQQLSSGRESFSPDASFFDGPIAKNRMKFIRGTPKFAVEVRSEGDYGRAAEKAMADKRTDYFEAGTLVVWDVDPLAQTVTKYTPTGSKRFAIEESADAEPAVTGWSMNLADVFAES